MKVFSTCILILFSWSNFAQSIDPTECGDTSLEVLYLNGVLTKWSGAIKSRNNIHTLVKNDHDKTRISPNGVEDICYKYIYNQNRGIYDFVEVLAQKIREADSNLNEKEVYKKVAEYWFSDRGWLANMPGDFPEKLKEAEIQRVQSTEYSTLHSDVAAVVSTDLQKRSVLVVSHSQGNLFANLLYEELKNGPNIERLKHYANLQVGSAASHIAAKQESYGDYYTSKQDKVIAGLGQLGSILPPNVDADYLGNITTDPFGHFFIGTYTNSDVKGRMDGEEVFRPMSEIFMDKLSALAEKITGRYCEPIDNLKLKVLGASDFHQISDNESKYLYMGLYNSDGSAFSGDTSLYGLYSVPPPHSTKYEPDEVKPVLDLNGDFLGFNQVSYVSGQEHAENLKGKDLALIHHSDYEKLKNNKPMECGIQHYTYVKSLISHRVDNEYDPNYAYLPQGPFRGVLDVKTADEVVNITYNGKQMGKEEDDTSFCTYFSEYKDCDWGIKESVSFPGSFKLSLTNGSELTVPLEVPPIDFDIKLEVKEVHEERNFYEVEAIFQGGEVYGRSGKFYHEAWISDGETHTNTGKLSSGDNVGSRSSRPNIGYFYCGRRAYVVPIQRIGSSGKYYRFDLMKVLGPAC
ncbi:MAG: hypothetical protein CME64_06865 [Halobacteriovoraceae bacterium]|nr:hypothetical protein [Halobacteriovoraceae bacterium]|tara:strand:+ start:6542 stop:8434 length:1893 start_codon:yes stop_codon:yes gene_type:complete